MGATCRVQANTFHGKLSSLVLYVLFFGDSVSVSLLLDPLQDTFSSLIMSLLFQFLKCVKDFLVIIIIKNDLYGAFQILIYKGKSRGHKKNP